ncbi:hypothetical protein [Acrocarpospora phusangensis]|uniref:hypothetical protein n=1 Tax=Acrocarpospora phusangensis TaxID=1070424 RepID=UPI0019514D3D|nr:hypothetical protein [Acrocarpospora phusangensis]
MDLVYNGKGRRPRKCDEHKNTRPSRQKPSASASAAGPAATKAEQLAEAAAEVLCQANEWLAMGAFLAGLVDTSSKLAGREEKFREQAVAALVLDPDLSKMILRMGARSGKFALAGAYLSLLGGVVPVAIEEIREIREARRAEAEV